MQKKIIFTLLLVFTMSVIHANEYKKHHTVNSVLGDISFIEKYGKKPDANTNEVLRIKTHLEYVENLLRNKDVSGLSGELKDKREQLLDLLHEYRLAGHFPKNYDYPGIRIPCFIDKDGNICAVGYLIEQTEGRAVAEEINAYFQYNYLPEMKDKKIDDWIKNSGLTAEECAMIQPGYGYVQPVITATVNPAATYSWTIAPSKEEIALKKKVKELEEEKLKLQHSLDSVRVEMNNREQQASLIQKKLEADVKKNNSKIKSLNRSHENEVAGLNKIIYLTSAFGLISLLLAFYFFFKKKKKLALA